MALLHIVDVHSAAFELLVEFQTLILFFIDHFLLELLNSLLMLPTLHPYLLLDP